MTGTKYFVSQTKSDLVSVLIYWSFYRGVRIQALGIAMMGGPLSQSTSKLEIQVAATCQGIPPETLTQKSCWRGRVLSAGTPLQQPEHQPAPVLMSIMHCRSCGFRGGTRASVVPLLVAVLEDGLMGGPLACRGPALLMW